MLYKRLNLKGIGITRRGPSQEELSSNRVVSGNDLLPMVPFLSGWVNAYSAYVPDFLHRSSPTNPLLRRLFAQKPR